MRLTTKDAAVIVGAMILASALTTAYFYHDLPQTLVTHWNSSGEANGTADKSWGVFLVPIIAAFLSLLLFALPSLDPIDKGYKNFRKEYDWLIVLLAAFLSLLQVVTLVWNLGLHFNISRFIAPLVGLLFYFIGTLMPGFKRNWFAGIRTPWTLSSDAVWTQTHEHAGSVFHLVGIVACFGAILPRYSFYFLFVPTILGAVWVTLYSYLVFRKGAAS